MIGFDLIRASIDAFKVILDFVVYFYFGFGMYGLIKKKLKKEHIKISVINKEGKKVQIKLKEGEGEEIDRLISLVKLEKEKAGILRKAEE